MTWAEQHTLKNSTVGRE